MNWRNKNLNKNDKSGHHAKWIVNIMITLGML